MSDEKIVPIATWEFDNFSHEHWAEQKAGVVDATKSYIEVSDVDNGGLWDQQLSVVVNRQEQLVIEASRDQWGTWITLRIGETAFTVAQEDQTMSFVDALIAGLTKLKEITDFETTPPKMVENPPR